MFKKIACLYSHDGFDLDVLLNQKDLLAENGFFTIATSKIIKCDLLIVLRANSNTFPFYNLNTENVGRVLFIDYSGQEVFQVFFNCNHPNKYLITSNNQLNGNGIFFGFPFVSIKRWVRKNSQENQNRSIRFIHIGNYKFSSNADHLIQFFNDAIKSLETIVFGSGWEKVLPKVLYKGAVSVEKVSDIYAKSQIALGIKHPFQRGNSISGRYWHAPLNGCALLVEDLYLADLIPGIIYVDYRSDLKYINGLKTNSTQIQKNALLFWDESNKLQLSLINTGEDVIVKSTSDVFKYTFYWITNLFYQNFKDLKRIVHSLIRRKITIV
jgi:hypothetical protein